jgi:hypothetical protein
MTDHRIRGSRGLAVKIALVGAGIAAGAITATAIGADASTTSGTGSTTGTAIASSTRYGGLSDYGGSQPIRPDEKSLGSALTAKLRAAALKAVPGGSVYRIETDAGDGTYEAHMINAHGKAVTVKFDRSGNVLGVEAGMGAGDPRLSH